MADFCPKCAHYRFSHNLNEKNKFSLESLDDLENKCDYDVNPYRSAKKLKIGYCIRLCCEGCGLAEIERVGKDLYNVTFSLPPKGEIIERLSLEQINTRFSCIKESHPNKSPFAFHSLLRIWN